MLQSLVWEIGEWSRRSQAFLALALVSLLFLLDVLVVGREISLAIFYLVPIALASWFLGRNVGVGFSILSATAWWVADLAGGAEYSHAVIGLWNAYVRLGFFLIVALTVAWQRLARLALEQAPEREREASRRDPLTGLLNSYGLFDLAEEALRRAQSSAQPVTVVFINVDKMRDYNNFFGRNAGNVVLIDIGEKIQRLVRPGDLAARFNGDEFAILLFGIDADAARRFAGAVHELFKELQVRFGRPVQASVGIVVATNPRGNQLHALLHQAERLMYSVKDAGKNAVRLEVFGSRSDNTPMAWMVPKRLPSASSGIGAAVLEQPA